MEKVCRRGICSPRDVSGLNVFSSSVQKICGERSLFLSLLSLSLSLSLSRPSLSLLYSDLLLTLCDVMTSRTWLICWQTGPHKTSKYTLQKTITSGRWFYLRFVKVLDIDAHEQLIYIFMIECMGGAPGIKGKFIILRIYRPCQPIFQPSTWQPSRFAACGL